MQNTTHLSKNLLPYRDNAVCIVIKEGHFLLVQLNSWPDSYWKFPQGGMEKNEKEEEGVLRELHEELGTKSFNILGKSKYTNKYDWPDDIIDKVKRKWRGQHQKFFLVEYYGNDKEISIDKAELRTYKWVQFDELLESIDNKSKLFTNYKQIILKVLNEFENVLAEFNVHK